MVHSELKILRDERGSSLLGAMAILALVGVLGMGIVNLVDAGRKSAVRNQLLMTRRVLMDQLAHSVTAPANLLSSLSGSATTNAMLRKCLIDDSLFTGEGDDCVVLSGNDNWYLAVITDATLASGAHLIASGEPAYPVQYDAKGEICAAPAPCAFSALVEFNPHCASDAPVCKIADSISLRLRLVPTAAIPFMRETATTLNVVINDGSSVSISQPGEIEPPPPPPSSIVDSVEPAFVNTSAALDGSSGAWDPSGSGSVSAAPPPPPPPPPAPSFASCGAGTVAGTSSCVQLRL